MAAARGRGGGKTPERVVELLREAVEKSSQSAVSRDTGLTQSAIGRYIQGIGEPSQSTLEKLAAYFGVSVAWLRGGKVGPLERFLEELKTKGVDPATYNITVSEKMGEEHDYWGELVAGKAILNSEHVNVLCNFFDINQFWVETGEHPTLLTSGGTLGTVTKDSTDLVKKYVDLSDFDFDDYMRWGLQNIDVTGKYAELYDAFCKIPDENKGEALKMLSFRLHLISIRKSRAAADPPDNPNQND